MGKLPNLMHEDAYGKSVQVGFSGYNHNLYAGDGELWDMENMASDLMPMLAPRKSRYAVKNAILQKNIKANTMAVYDKFYHIEGTDFYVDGVKKGTVSPSATEEKQIIPFGTQILIWPDKKYYNRETDAFGDLEATWTGVADFKDGTYAEENAERNTIYAEGAEWATYFRVGDGVEISGSSTDENNKTIIIREIEGDNLRFYENSFQNTTGERITIQRKVPEMDFLCTNENRVWGCRKDEIFASKPGDATNWNVFDGIATDSFAAAVGSAGDFTAAISFLGYPCFFKENHIYKVYGTKPSDFQVMGSASLGVMHGSHKSLAVAGETLFYLARTGVATYTGGMPKSISTPFGSVSYQNGVAGSDGKKYYISMQDTNSGFYSLFVYDTEKGVWHREDNTKALDFGYGNGGLFMLTESGEVIHTKKTIYIGGESGAAEANTPEADFTSMAETGDYTAGSPNRKGVARAEVRACLDPGAELTVYIQFDSSGTWQKIKTLSASKKKSVALPIIPRRCDHFRLKFQGAGAWRVESLALYYYIGSER